MAPMRHTQLICLSTTALLLLHCVKASNGPQAASPRADPSHRALVSALQAGGYVLYFRHAAADVCVDRTELGGADGTTTPDWWKNCDKSCATATARQLSATGVAQATTIGQQLKRLQVPIGKVVASQYCRTQDTAQGMALGPPIETSADLTYFVYGEATRCEKSLALLATPPPAGTNTALIGHAGSGCGPLDALAFGEAAIYKPDGKGHAELIQRVPWDRWQTWNPHP